MAVSDARQCTAVSTRTGSRCRQPATKGADVCRFHGAGGVADSGAEHREKATSSGAACVGAPQQNTNALKHGAYSPRLLADEEPLYEEKRSAFTDALGGVDVFDRELVHLLSLIAVKVDIAVMRGAEHAAYGGMIKQILDLMRELKATRASRDPVTDGPALTYADLVEALRARAANPPSAIGGADDADALLPATEAAPDAGPDPALAPFTCARCGTTTDLGLDAEGRACCPNCGLLVEPEVSSEQPTADANADTGSVTPTMPPTATTPTEEGAHP